MAQKVSADKFYSMTEDFSIDLIALYKVTEARVMEILAQAEKNGWTPEETMEKIEEVL